jgi:hypothetical protein
MRNLRRLSLLPTLATVAVISSVYLQGYVDSGRRWTAATVQYYVNPHSMYLSPDLAINAVRTAAAAWNDAGANIELVYAGTTSGASLTLNYKNEVFFRDSSNGSYAAETYSWWDSNNRYKDSDIVFYEGAFKYFSVSGCAQGVYAENVGTHEFGHMLGLRHSPVSGATMQASMPSYCDRTWMTLDSDDLSGIRALYPATTSSVTTNSPPSVTVTSPVGGTSFPDGAGITFSASARDSEDGDLTPRLVWTSNLAGPIGTGGAFTKVLSAGTHTITARVTDSGSLSGSQQLTLTVAASASAAPDSGRLAVRAYKVKGQQKADLTWSGLDGASVDVYRNGSRVASPANSGGMTDHINKNGGGSYRYKVCVSGTATCSNEAAVSF